MSGPVEEDLLRSACISHQRMIISATYRWLTYQIHKYYESLFAWTNGAD